MKGSRLDTEPPITSSRSLSPADTVAAVCQSPPIPSDVPGREIGSVCVVSSHLDSPHEQRFHYASACGTLEYRKNLHLIKTSQILLKSFALSQGFFFLTGNIWRRRNHFFASWNVTYGHQFTTSESGVFAPSNYNCNLLNIFLEIALLFCEKIEWKCSDWCFPVALFLSINSKGCVQDSSTLG